MVEEQSDKNWMETSASFAPAVLGAAAGIVVGDLMQRDARRPVALALLALGVSALAPSVVKTVAKKVNGPQSKRGARRTLSSIRDAGIVADEFADLEDDVNLSL